MRILSITRLYLIVLFALFCQISVFAQGVTTSSIYGRIQDDNGEALIGANVLVQHLPSGTNYGNATDLDGFFRIPGMRVGGPYRITISYTGYEDYVRENIFLTLGQSFQLNTTLKETSVELEGVEVTASRNNIFDGTRTGQESVVDERLINETLPTITRSIIDFARFNPLATVDESTDGFNISLAGQNNRYNTIYIDGAVNNDVFGLSGSGTNGGQTGVQPISIDAIEQFQIAVAPFDVRQSGFSGGSINAVTRSGTNNLEGSAYYFLRNESLAGRAPTTPFNEDVSRSDRDRLDDFTAQTYGLRLGGPIIKNKLFFFVNAEIQRDNRPQPFDFGNYNGDATLEDINALINKLRTEFNYDPGSFDNNEFFLNSEKYLVKLDWNINNNHRLSLRHSYVNADNLEARRSTPNAINFLNGSERFASTTNSTALELTSLFGTNFSNKLTLGATIVRDDRDPDGTPFPTVEISDGNNIDIEFGAERFSAANLLDQDVFTINNDFSWFQGKHNIVLGFNFEYFNAGNLFIRNNFGRYRYFNGLDAFLNDQPAARFERSFSLVDQEIGDETQAIAEFSQSIFGIYLQDEFQVTDNFRVTGGIRLDIVNFPDNQPVNQSFNTETVAAIEEAGYDLQGARTGTFIDNQTLFSPRLGFNWDILGDNSTQLRGGIGVFSSRIPLVWPGGAYNNYGLNIGEVVLSNQAFEPEVSKQAPLTLPTEPSGQVDLFAADFKTPQVLKINLAVDRKLPWGLIGTIEGVYTDNINNVRYQNLNLRPSSRNLQDGQDNRPLFDGLNVNFGDNPLDARYTYIMLASNTDLGYSYNIAATLTKPFTNGFAASLSYSYGDSYSVFDGGSSQNNSQWREYFTPYGRNFIGNPNPSQFTIDVPDVQRSRFSQGHRIFATASYEIDYLDAMRSKLALTLNAQSGDPFTYVVGARNFAFTDDGGFDNSELIYIPRTQDEINLVDITDDDNNVLFTAQEQWDAFNRFIEDDDHLSENRGSYNERNGNRFPFTTTLDLKFIQDFYIEMKNGKRNTLQLTFDIFNFTNLLNADWGTIYNFRFGTYNLIDLDRLEFVDETTRRPAYTLNTEILNGEDPWEDNVDDSGFRTSRWQMQIGVRYIFQ